MTKDVRMDAYQEAARVTAVYPEECRIVYPTLGLASEAGEVAGKVKKVLRDSDGQFSVEQIETIKDELGDVLWYVAALAGDLDLSMSDIAQGNLDKLRSRAERGALQGNGDRR